MDRIELAQVKVKVKDKVFPCLIMPHAMKTYGDWRYMRVYPKVSGLSQ